MSETESSNKTPVRFDGVTPILVVRDFAASLDYYVKVLGFKLEWGGGGFGSVSRDRCHIFLSQGDQGNPGAWIWVGVEDVDALFEEYRAKGAKVRHPPTNYEWACEMQVEDLDGNVLRMGSEPKEGEPIGEWLDMRGDAWVKSPDGGSMRVKRS